MYNGFIFELNVKGKTKYCFIESEEKRKTRGIANSFLDFFVSRLNNMSKSFSDEQLKNTCTYILKNMYNAKIKRSMDFETFFIITKKGKKDISENDLIWLEI